MVLTIQGVTKLFRPHYAFQFTEDTGTGKTRIPEYVFHLPTLDFRAFIRYFITNLVIYRK